MIPRVFVSSTYYDLKHVRERIEKFIDNYGFEPILFESDKVTYQHEKEIDHSAYYEVSLCHIMVLIVGGRYGSPTSQNRQDEERKKYDEDYISITRKEFETANQKNIPILIFVDKNVHGEYQTYKENQEYFDELYLTKTKGDKEQKKFKFAHVDHINVFKFIDLIRTKPIKTFEKVEEIESYIKSQLSGMFYLYLESLKKKSDDNKILDTISELNNVTLRMNEMLTSVGKEILGKDKKEYEKVIDSQLAIMIDFFGEQFSSSIEFENDFPDEILNQIDLDKAAQIIYDNALKIEIPTIGKKSSYTELQKFNSNTNRVITLDLQTKLSSIHNEIIIKQFNFRQLNKVLHDKVLPFIKNSNDEKLIIDQIKSVIKWKLTELPF
jgi:hypothetical protein